MTTERDAPESREIRDYTPAFQVPKTMNNLMGKDFFWGKVDAAVVLVALAIFCTSWATIDLWTGLLRGDNAVERIGGTVAGLLLPAIIGGAVIHFLRIRLRHFVPLAYCLYGIVEVRLRGPVTGNRPHRREPKTLLRLWTYRSDLNLSDHERS